MAMFSAMALAVALGSSHGTSQTYPPASVPPAGYAAPQASIVVPYQIARNGGDGITAEQARQMLTLLGKMPTGEQAERMIDALESIETILQGAAREPVAPKGVTSPAQPQAAPKASPRAKAPVGPTKLQAMQGACGGCHTPSKQQGGFILFASDDRKSLKPFTNREKKLISEKIEAEEMPPKDSPQLTPAAKAAMIRW